MCRRFLQAILGILLVITLLASTAILVNAEGEQSWRLLHDSYSSTAANDATVHYRDVIMSKTGDTSSSPYSMSVPADQTVWWYAEYSAQLPVSFGTNVDWDIYLWHEGASDEEIKADVYSIAQDGSITHLATSGWVAATDSNTEITVQGITDQEQLTPQDSILGLRISWQGSESSFSVYYYRTDTGRLSRLASPSSDPGYPTPELPTIALLSAGLLTIGICIWFGQRKEQNTI